MMIVTQRRKNQTKLNSYAKSSKLKAVRKMLLSDIQAYAQTVSGNNLAYEVITNVMDKRLEEVAQKVLPGCKLQVYKMKTIKRGTIDMKKVLKDAQEGVNDEIKELEENPDAQNALTKAQVDEPTEK